MKLKNKPQAPRMSDREFLNFFKQRFMLMKAKREKYEQVRDEVDLIMLKQPELDDYDNYLVSIFEERNIMEMSAGREGSNLNYYLEPTWQPDANEIEVVKMLLDYCIREGEFHKEWRKGLWERRRYGNCAFITRIREQVVEKYEPTWEDYTGVYDMEYEPHIEVKNIFTPQWIPIRNVRVDDKAINSGMKFATDCIWQETCTWNEIQKRRGQNSKFKNLDKLPNSSLNLDEPYPIDNGSTAMTTEGNKGIVIQYYVNKDTWEFAIIGGYHHVLYRGKNMNGTLPLAIAQYFPDEACIYSMGIVKKIQPMSVYKTEITQHLLDNSRMSGSPLLFLGNRAEVDGTSAISANKINKIEMTWGITDAQFANVPSNINNYQQVLEYIQQQIIQDTWENLTSTYQASADQLGTVEIIETNRQVRLGSVNDNRNLLLSELLQSAVDNIVDYGFQLLKKKDPKTGKIIYPAIVVKDKSIKQKGNKLEIEEDMGNRGYFELKKDMIKSRYRIVVTTASNAGIRKIAERNNLTQYVNNKVALRNLNPQLVDPEELKNIGKKMNQVYDRDFTEFPSSKKEEMKKKIAQEIETIKGMVGLNPSPSLAEGWDPMAWVTDMQSQMWAESWMESIVSWGQGTSPL